MDSCLRSDADNIKLLRRLSFLIKNKGECQAMVKIELSSDSCEIAGDLKKMMKNTQSCSLGNPPETASKS